MFSKSVCTFHSDLQLDTELNNIRAQRSPLLTSLKFLRPIHQRGYFWHTQGRAWNKAIIEPFSPFLRLAWLAAALRYTDFFALQMILCDRNAKNEYLANKNKLRVIILLTHINSDCMENKDVEQVQKGITGGPLWSLLDFVQTTQVPAVWEF